MIAAFKSVGTTAFDVTLLDIEGKEQGFQSSRSVDELQRTIGRRLDAAATVQHSLVIRPRSTTTLLIQLDDFTPEKAALMDPFAFLTVHTSPGNCQVWLAVSDGPKGREEAKQFRTRVRRGAGADQSATGATRIAGSINFKSKYAPNFPTVSLGQVNAGKTITVDQLERAGLISREQTAPQAAASVPPPVAARPASGRHWPDYQQALRGAPLKPDNMPDRSRADYMFCKWAIERGWSIEETAEKLTEVSTKAQERIQVKDDRGYATLTARNAAAAIERERNRRQAPKIWARPGR